MKQLKVIIAKWLVKLGHKLNPRCVNLSSRPLVELPLSSSNIRLIQIDRKFDKIDSIRVRRDYAKKYMMQCVQQDLFDAIADSDAISWSVTDNNDGCVRVRACIYVTNYAKVIDKYCEKFEPKNTV